MSTFAQIKTNIGINLADAGQVHFTAADLQISLDLAYQDIVALSRCIIKKITLDWISDLSYYDFKTDCDIADFLAVIAIYNNNNNRWINDDITLLQFDDLRDNWETVHGQTTNWAFASVNKTAIYPKLELATGNFDLYYWATAPAVIDGETPLIATDCQKLLEFYSTADQLETVDEVGKARMFWGMYYELLETYIARTETLARADLRVII